MVLPIIHADILLIARIFPRPCGARKNTALLVKYPPVLSVKPSNKVYLIQSNLAEHSHGQYLLKGTMSAIFSNILKSQKSHLHQWKPENNGSVLLKFAVLAHWNYQ